MAFITPTQFLLYYDRYRVAEYVSDNQTGEPVDVSSLPTDPVLEEFANVATGMILQAARVGARYSRADLEALASDAISGGPLRQLCASLMRGQLVIRKGYNLAGVKNLAPDYETSLGQLDLIYSGERLFDIGAVLDPSGTTETGPLMPSPPNFPYTQQIACGYFGNTGWRLNPSLGYGANGPCGCG